MTLLQNKLMINRDLTRPEFMIGVSKELLLKGKAHNNEPPCTNQLKSMAFDIAKSKHSLFFTKQAILMRRSTILSLHLLLVFLAVSYLLLSNVQPEIETLTSRTSLESCPGPNLMKLLMVIMYFRAIGFFSNGVTDNKSS
jgi:hypothetical protein